MWQADTFDPVTIDRELGWAEAIGMNTMRVFLHNLLWEQDPKGFSIASISFLPSAPAITSAPIFVLFDSCWDPNPKLGPQHPPIPGVHNSGWVQAPGAEILADPSQYPRLESYVPGVIGPLPTIPASSPGISGMSPTTATTAPMARATRRTRTNWSWLCCRRSSPGPAPPIPSSHSPAASGTATGVRSHP
jgi:hypothetical protein